MKKQVVLIISALTLLGASAAECVFEAGFARADITPPLGVFMPGYYQERHAKKILDPLQVNMVAFSYGAKTALVAQIDTEGLSDAVADRMRDAIVSATRVDRDAILLHASHTHDGGFLAMKSDHGSSASSGDGVPEFSGPIDRVYLDLCVTRVVDAARAAIEDLKPAKLSCGTSSAKRISFGRRYLMKDGRVATNPGTNNPNIVRPVGTADDTVQVLRIDREGAKAICVINFQTHPDVVGGETITADWPGLTRTVFEAATMGEANCLVLNGTQGDVNHCNVLPKPGEMNGLKRDFDAVDRGYDHAKHMANVIAGAALSVWMKCAPLDAGEIRFARREVKVPANKAKDSDEKNLAWANDVWALHEKSLKEGVVATSNDYDTKKYGWKDMELTTEVARAGRIRNMAKHDDYHLIPVWGIALGDVAFGAFPGEPFNDIGIAIRKQSPFKMTILTCLTNGSRGYFPFSDSYTQGGYESATSPFGPSVADDLIAGETALLKSLKDVLTPRPRNSEDWWVRKLSRNLGLIRASGGKFDVVMFGDSITHYWEVGEGPDESHDIEILQKKWSILNCGYGGDRIENLLWRLENGELDGYKAKVVTLMIGTNNSGDLASDIVLGVRRAIELIEAKQPQAKIVLTSYLPCGKGRGGAKRAKLESVTPALKDMAKSDKHIVWHDISNLFLNADGTLNEKLMDFEYLHPSTEGYRVWREALEPLLEKLL